MQTYYTPQFLQREIQDMRDFLKYSRSSNVTLDQYKICQNILDSCNLIAESRDPQFFKVMQEEIIDRLYKVYRICR